MRVAAHQMPLVSTRGLDALALIARRVRECEVLCTGKDRAEDLLVADLP